MFNEVLEDRGLGGCPGECFLELVWVTVLRRFTSVVTQPSRAPPLPPDGVLEREAEMESGLNTSPLSLCSPPDVRQMLWPKLERPKSRPLHLSETSWVPGQLGHKHRDLPWATLFTSEWSG